MINELKLWVFVTRVCLIFRSKSLSGSRFEPEVLWCLKAPQNHNPALITGHLMHPALRQRCRRYNQTCGSHYSPNELSRICQPTKQAGEPRGGGLRVVLRSTERWLRGRGAGVWHLTRGRSSLKCHFWAICSSAWKRPISRTVPISGERLSSITVGSMMILAGVYWRAILRKTDGGSGGGSDDLIHSVVSHTGSIPKGPQRRSRSVCKCKTFYTKIFYPQDLNAEN